MPFSEQDSGTLPFRLKDYLELVDWGGREVKRHKRGYIPASAPPILDRLQMHAAPVLKYLAREDRSPFTALGPLVCCGLLLHRLAENLSMDTCLATGFVPKGRSTIQSYFRFRRQAV